MSQTLTIDTIVGPKNILAPGGWEFDKTAALVWFSLLARTADLMKPQRTLRDRAVLQGKIDALARVLSSALGMAPFYWEEQARLLKGKI